ncbi:PTS sugar transporter subunit IIA [Photobacterium sp. BZF1]|uniref:PTS sugar transporter subunit IIA n=1 Tax=Photobacterium sp. BZF1 TaxID=1904457 RepID=UPI001653D749|nr:PTS sugar transporter subunit IIA [Photobacterium sp. BZF1]MBC7005078.1 PTS sugar transporter subunit IIA [Photobacterium sp. BZF1]
MLSKLLTHDHIQIMSKVDDWQSAIKIACQPLIDKQVICAEYTNAIIETAKNIGPYFVLAPSIAMPHARPEQGVNENGLSLLIVKEGVEFNSTENDPVKFILLLAAKNSDKHIELITSISELFCNEKDVNDIINAKGVNEVTEITKKY